MNYKKLFFCIVVFCLHAVNFVYGMEEKWKYLETKPIHTAILSSASFEPMQIICTTKGDTFLLAKDNNQKTLKTYIFKLAISKQQDNKDLQPTAEWKIQERLFLARSGTIIAIHAIEDKLFAIIQNGSNYSITYTNPNDILPRWGDVTYLARNASETKKLAHLAGDSLNKIWVIYQYSYKDSKSFYLSDKKEIRHMFSPTTFAYTPSQDNDYRSVDRNNDHEWAITDNNQLVHITANQPPNKFTSDTIQNINTIHVDPNNVVYGSNDTDVYKWDSASKNFVQLKHFERENSKLTFYFCFHKKNPVHAFDRHGTMYNLAPSRRRKKKTVIKQSVPVPIEKVPSPLSSPSQEDDITIPSSSSSEDSSEEVSAKQDLPSADEITLSSSSSSSSQSNEAPVSSALQVPEIEPHYGFIQRDYGHWSLPPETIGISVPKSPKKPQSQPHALLPYIHQAQTHDTATQQKKVPLIAQAPLATDEALRSWAGKAVGLTTFASALGWATGYSPLLGMIKYPFYTAIGTGVPAGLYSGLYQRLQNTYQTKLDATKKASQNWLNNLKRLQFNTHPQAVPIANKTYLLSNQFNNANDIKLSNKNWHLYLTPRDTDLTKTFDNVVKTLKESKTYKDNIEYVAIRPVPGIPRTEPGRLLRGDVLPSIIVATNLQSTNNNNKRTIKHIADTIKKTTDTNNISSTHYQPLFSDKMTFPEDGTKQKNLIYSSDRSLTQAMEDYNKKSWWQKLTWDPKSE